MTEPRSLPEALNIDPSTPNYFTLAPAPGDERAPSRWFKVINEMGGLECVYEARGLTLERVIAEETRHFPSQCEPHNAYDLTILDGPLVAAVVRNFGTGDGTFKVLPIGAEWVWHVNDMDAMDELEPDDDDGPVIPDPDTLSESDLDEEAGPDALTDDERSILKVIRGAGLSAEDASEYLIRGAKEDDDDTMEGIRALTRFRAERIASRPLAYSVTEGDYHIQHFPRRWTEDQVIAEALAEWPGDGPTHDQAVWHGEKLVAVLKAKPDGTAEVVRV